MHLLSKVDALFDPGKEFYSLFLRNDNKFHTLQNGVIWELPMTAKRRIIEVNKFKAKDNTSFYISMCRPFSTINARYIGGSDQSFEFQWLRHTVFRRGWQGAPKTIEGGEPNSSSSITRLSYDPPWVRRDVSDERWKHTPLSKITNSSAHRKK